MDYRDARRAHPTAQSTVAHTMRYGTTYEKYYSAYTQTAQNVDELAHTISGRGEHKYCHCIDDAKVETQIE